MRIGIIISLLLLLTVIQPVIRPASALWLNESSGNDTYSQSANPNTIFGNDLYNLYVSYSGVHSRAYIFLWFNNVSKLFNNHTVINDVILKVDVISTDTTGVVVNVSSIDSAWDETSLTWNNQPTSTDYSDNQLDLTALGNSSVNITKTLRNLLGKSLFYGLALKNDTSGNKYSDIAPKELYQSYPIPTLNISYTTVNNISSVPQISYPSNNSRHFNNSMNFTWNQSIDADNDPITYHYQVSNQSNFSYIINQSNVTNNWTGSVSTNDGVTYYTRVRSYDGYNYSSWSPTIQFDEFSNLEFTAKSNSESQIYQNSQATSISVHIIDLGGGSIANASVGVTFNGNETNYSMTNSSNTWSYSFSSGTVGTYTITHFYATETDGGSNSTSWSQAFSVVPVVGSGSPGGGSPGGSTGSPSPSATAAINISLPKTVNIEDVGKDTVGQTIFTLIAIAGFGIVLLGTDQQSNQLKMYVSGTILILIGTYALGIWGYA